MGSGGGSQTTNTYDPAYNAGLLEIQQEQQGWAAQFVNLFQYGVTYDPNEVVWGKTIDGKWVSEEELKDSPYGKDYFTPDPAAARYEFALRSRMAQGMSEAEAKSELHRQGIYEPDSGGWLRNEAQLERKTRGELEGYDPAAQVSEMELMQQGIASAAQLLPQQTALAETQIGADMRLIPAQTDVAMAQLNEELGLVPQRAGLESAMIGDTQAALEQRAPVREAFYTSALEGVDKGRRMDQAQADVEHAFGLGKDEFERGIFTSGLKVNPADAGYISALNEREIAKAAGIAGARGSARTLAEDEMFRRLQSAMSA